jgi:hypothetical protein
MKFAKYLIAASMLAVAGSATATTVNFTDEESPGVTCCGLMASNAYAAYGLTVNDAYWYRDGRDTFDQEGIAIRNAPTATIIFNSGTNGVSFQYFVIAGNRGVYEAFDAASNSLGSLVVSASNGNLLGTHAFGGLVDRLTFSGNAGFVQVSGVTFEGQKVPEPSILELLALGLAGSGFAARSRKA